MRKCPFCGEMIPSDVNICPICGEDLPSGEMIECPICGELIEKGTNICPYCQEEISENLIVDSHQTVENQAIEEARRKAEEERAAEEARRKAEGESLPHPKKTGKKGNNQSKIVTICAIIGVLLIVAGIIIFVLLRNEEKTTTPTGYKKLSPIELTDSVKSRLPEGTAILATIDNGNIHRLYYQTDGQIMLYDAESNTTHEIDIDGIYSGATIESAKLSPDEKYIMMVAGKGEGMNSKLLRLNVMTTNISEIASGEVEVSGKGYKVTTDGKIFYYDNSGELSASEDIEQTEPAEEEISEKAPQETKSKPQSSQQNKGKSKQQKTKPEPEPEPEQPQQSQGTGFRLVPVDKIPD